MIKVSSVIKLLFLFCLFAGNLAAQKKDRVEVFEKMLADAPQKNCKDFKAGDAVNLPKPNYPAQARAARVGGTSRVWIKIDEKGAAEIDRSEGNKMLQDAAIDAARRVRFVPSVCDGAGVKVSAVLIYNFIPNIAAENYFAPTRAEDFADVKPDSPFFEAIKNLAENYHLAFGYTDKKFYADAPLTRGDFAQALRLTLDLLSERAKAANKLPREINLFAPANPHKLVSADQIRDLKKNDAFADSVKTLLLTYDIALTNEQGEFQGRLPMTQNEALEVWTQIFGADAVPVNFQKINDGDVLLTRGEFALFLEESLQVLTYKAMP